MGRGYRALLGRLTTYVVNSWGGDSKDDLSAEQRKIGNLSTSSVVSSLIRNADDAPRPIGEGRHIIVLDIDHQAHLIESSTPGHFHLYVEIPPVTWREYRRFLEAAAMVGLIDYGYANASVDRGHSDVRLPWVGKPVSDVTPVPAPVTDDLDPF